MPAHQTDEAVFRSVLPEDVDWKPFPALPPSVRLAVLVDRPTEQGRYVIRVSGVFYWARSGEYVSQVWRSGHSASNTWTQKMTRDATEPFLEAVCREHGELRREFDTPGGQQSSLRCPLARIVRTVAIGAQSVPRDGLALDAATLCEAFQRTAETHADGPALALYGSEQHLTWEDYRTRVSFVAAGLAAIGVRREDTLAMMLANRPEAVIIDTAAMHLGAIPFSVYNTSAVEQLEYLFEDAGCRIVFTEAQFVDRVREAGQRVGSLEQIVLVDGEPTSTGTLHALEALGVGDFDLGAASRSVGEQDVATLIYTSGTTGPPKAVELTHANLLAQARMLDAMVPATPAGRRVSYLPMAHLADRAHAHYGPIISGAHVTFVPEMTLVLGAVAEVRPDVWGAVPRVWEKLKAALEAGFAAEPDEERRTAVANALDLSLRVVRMQQAAQEVDAELLAARERADSEIFAPLRAQLGLDRVEYVGSGAAPISVEVLEFFAALGLPICEVWGMTELSLIATMNPPDALRLGTVGVALPGIELRLADDGELLVRGATVMRGYRGDPARTADAVDPDGWLHTGDIAAIDPDGYVTIVDRKKELIINAGGKNMSPANIENKIKAACPLIGSAVAIGDRRPYNTALIVLDPLAAASFLALRGVAAAGPSDLAAHPALRDELDAGIDRANASLSRVEQIKRYTIIPGEWLPGGDELTPTMKLRRRPISEKYAAEIDAMYS